MDKPDLSKGDPLGGDAGGYADAPPPRPHETPERPKSALPDYGGGPVPPGAFAGKPPAPRLPPGTVYADWGRRALAAIVDIVIVGGLSLLLLAVLGAGFFADGDLGTAEIVVGLFLFFLVFAALALLYAPIVMAKTNGQTLGKMMTGCRVVRTDGQRVTFGWAMLREVVVKGLLFGLLGSFTAGIAQVIDYVWPLFDGEKRSLHDMVVDSRVVRA